MQCEHCHEKEAEVHIREVTPEGTREHHFCRECAARHTLPGGIPVLSLEIMLGGALGKALQEDVSPEEEPEASVLTIPSGMPVVCPRCGIGAEEALRSGDMGCAVCYETFRPALQGALERHHGATVHRGLRPSKISGEALVHWSTVRALRRELGRAVALEAYEEAAVLRDRLRGLAATECSHE